MEKNAFCIHYRFNLSCLPVLLPDVHFFTFKLLFENKFEYINSIFKKVFIATHIAGLGS